MPCNGRELATPTFAYYTVHTSKTVKIAEAEHQVMSVACVAPETNEERAGHRFLAMRIQFAQMKNLRLMGLLPYMEKLGWLD